MFIRKKKTVIVADKNGQLGNQLFLFAHFISNAIEQGYNLYFPAFNELSVYFEDASKNKYGDYPVNSRVSRFNFVNKIFLFGIRYVIALMVRTMPVTKLYRIIRLYFRNDLHDEQHDFYNIEKESEFLSPKRFLILQGWSFRAPDAVIRQRDNVRPLFHIKSYWRERVDSLIASCRRECDVLIGVHARRGDYKTFMKGIYYYDDAAYGEYLKQISLLFPAKKIMFLICSNEDVSIQAPEGCLINFPHGHFIEDLYSLAACDYIIGPPSTFSQWASFYGNTPLKILMKKDSPIISVDEFKIADL